jgi:hypothetical protein
MTVPVSSANSSVYDPNAQFSPTEGCDPSTATCSPAAEQPPLGEATIPPVIIYGDAGARELVKELDAARRAADCSLEASNAVLSCAKVAIPAAGTLLLSPTGVGAAIGVAATLVESVSCGKDLRAYYDCVNQ